MTTQPADRRLVTEARIGDDVAPLGADGRLPDEHVPEHLEPAALYNAIEVGTATLERRRPLGLDVHALRADHAASALAIPCFDGSTEAIHPSVKYFPEGWNGYRYWMAHTPYTGNQAIVEQPSIACSNDRETWIDPPGVTNPIDQPAVPSQTSFYPDTEIFMEGDRMWVVYRANLAKYSDNGVLWSARQTLNLTGGSLRHTYVSPTLTRVGDEIWYWAVSNSDRSVHLHKSTTGMSGEFAHAGVCAFPQFATKKPWHIEVQNVEGVFVACVMYDTGGDGSIHIGTSVDGLDFTEMSGPILGVGSGGWDHGNIYRSSLVPLGPESPYPFEMFYSASSGGGTPVWGTGRTYITAAAPTAAGQGVRAPIQGRWHGPHPIEPATAVFGSTTGTVVPVYVPRKTRISHLGCEVTTAASAGKIRLGIYGSNHRDEPWIKIYGSPQITVAAAGIVEHAVDLTLEPGLYWLAYLQDETTFTVRTVGNHSIPPVSSTSFGGTDATKGMNSYGGYPLTSLPDQWGMGAARSYGALVKMKTRGL